VVRHPVVARIVMAYEEFEAHKSDNKDNSWVRLSIYK
jgi:phosphate starvation-inducible protein PhoH